LLRGDLGLHPLIGSTHGAHGIHSHPHSNHELCVASPFGLPQ
jgi:hypothetical protein